MKLFITAHQATNSGLDRYKRGSGVLSSIKRKSLEHMINTPVNVAAAQKVVNAVVNGAQGVIGNLIGQKTGELVGNKIVKAITKDNRKRGRSTGGSSSTTHNQPSKKVKVDINKLINGSGIILD